MFFHCSLSFNLSQFYLFIINLYIQLLLQEEGDLFPRDEAGKVITCEVDYLDTWKAMEKCVEKGLTQSIGVSNFNIEQLDRLLANSKVPPVNNQVCFCLNSNSIVIITTFFRLNVIRISTKRS